MSNYTEEILMEMTKMDLTKIATREFGVKILPAMNKQAISDVIMRGQAILSPPEVVDEATDEEVKVVEAVVAKVGPVVDNNRLVKILIPKTEKEVRPVFVGVQGTGYTIPRGIEIEVPWKVVHALGNAVESKYDPKTMEERLVPSYPFTMIN